MAKIVIIHSGLRGMSNACLAMADQLTKAGHTIYLGSPGNKGYTSTHPFLMVPLPEIPLNYKRPFLEKIKGLLHRSRLFESQLASLELVTLKKWLASNEVDLVLIDQEMHEFILALDSFSQPFILISQWFSTWQTKGNLPPNSKKKPHYNRLDKLAWLRSKWIRKITYAGQFAKQFGHTRRAFLYYMSKDLHFDPSRFLSFQFPMPFSYQNVPILLTTHPDLEFTTCPLPMVKYAFPMVLEERESYTDAHFDEPFKKILRAKVESNKKLICVTKTSMKGGDVKALITLIKALSSNENWISILGVGDAYDQCYNREENPFDNVYIFKSIPQLQVLKHADLSINHGGIHTINECIHFAVPMLIISGNKFDQNGCAARVHYHGCGVSLFTKQIKTEEIKKTIEQVLLSKECKNKIAMLSRTYHEAKERNHLASIIEEALQ